MNSLKIKIQKINEIFYKKIGDKSFNFYKNSENNYIRRTNNICESFLRVLIVKYAIFIQKFPF